MADHFDDIAADVEEEHALLDEEEEEHALSDDSNYESADSDDDCKEIAFRTVYRPEILALSGRTKCCVIYLYYTDGSGSGHKDCASCMIAYADAESDPVYVVRRHMSKPYDAIRHRFCGNCREPLHTIFPCNICPICTK